MSRSLIAGQFVGAFIGAILVYLSYLAHWARDRRPGPQARGLLDRPGDPQHRPANLITEIIGTFMLVFGILAISGLTMGDQVISGALATGAFPVGLLVLVIGLSLGGPTGYAINPARDLGPRIIHAILPIPGKGTLRLGVLLDPGRRPDHRRRRRRARGQGDLRPVTRYRLTAGLDPHMPVGAPPGRRGR